MVQEVSFNTFCSDVMECALYCRALALRSRLCGLLVHVVSDLVGGDQPPVEDPEQIKPPDPNDEWKQQLAKEEAMEANAAPTTDPDAIKSEADTLVTEPSVVNLVAETQQETWEPHEARPRTLSAADITLNVGVGLLPLPPSGHISPPQSAGTGTVECTVPATSLQPVETGSSTQAQTAGTAPPATYGPHAGLTAINTTGQAHSGALPRRSPLSHLHHNHSPRGSPLSHVHSRQMAEMPPPSPALDCLDVSPLLPPPPVLTIEMGRGDTIYEDEVVASQPSHLPQSLQAISRLLPARRPGGNGTARMALGRTTSSIVAAARALALGGDDVRRGAQDLQPACLLDNSFKGRPPPSDAGTERRGHSQIGELPPPAVVAAEIMRAVCTSTWMGEYRQAWTMCSPLKAKRKSVPDMEQLAMWYFNVVATMLNRQQMMHLSPTVGDLDSWLMSDSLVCVMDDNMWTDVRNLGTALHMQTRTCAHMPLQLPRFALLPAASATY